MASEDLLRSRGFNERLFEYVRTLPPEHNVVIARMGFYFGTDGGIDMARRFQTCKITTMYFGPLKNMSSM